MYACPKYMVGAVIKLINHLPLNFFPHKLAYSSYTYYKLGCASQPVCFFFLLPIRPCGILWHILLAIAIMYDQWRKQNLIFVISKFSFNGSIEAHCAIIVKLHLQLRMTASESNTIVNKWYIHTHLTNMCSICPCIIWTSSYISFLLVQVRLENIHASEIQEGNEKQTLALIWAIILGYQSE